MGYNIKIAFTILKNQISLNQIIWDKIARTLAIDGFSTCTDYFLTTFILYSEN